MSLSDYLVVVRRDTPRQTLLGAMCLGLAVACAGFLLGPTYFFLSGLGAALTGIAAWAWLGRLADEVDNRFEVRVPARVRQLRLASVACLILAAFGALLFLMSFFFHFVQVTKGM
jgi:hypothetical protein